MLKCSSSSVVSKTCSSSFSKPRFLRIFTFAIFSRIIQIANSITNLRILGTLVDGFLLFCRICTIVLANSASLIPALSYTLLDSSEVVNLKTSAASPNITSFLLTSRKKWAHVWLWRSTYRRYRNSDFLQVIEGIRTTVGTQVSQDPSSIHTKQGIIKCFHKLLFHLQFQNTMAIISAF